MELAIDGTERRRQRPHDATRQRDPYSGKKKTHTDRNSLLGKETTATVIDLGPPVAGKTPDKKAADEAMIASPVNTTLDQDTGFKAMNRRAYRRGHRRKHPKIKS